MNGPQRTHVVLVPGFVGFDALGTLEYYAGVTGVLEGLRGRADRPAAIHYFDNFPTASVELRSKRLAAWLAKRVARGDFGPEDRVALVGHSTGGLDIRQAVRRLAADPGGEQVVDGTCRIANERVLRSLGRLVFLSVPHYGTNLGDFACALGDAAKGVLKDAALGIRLNRGAIASARRFLTRLLPDARSDLLLAIIDALNESDENAGGSVDQRTGERETRSQFGLWIEHMSDDFSVVHDLRSFRDEVVGGSPAHASPGQRRWELDTWKAHGIRTCSYATWVPRAHGKTEKILDTLLPALKFLSRAADHLAGPVNLGAELWPLLAVSLPALLARVGIPAASLPAVVTALNAEPALLFDLFQAVCADRNGYFRNPNERTPGGIARFVERFGSGEPLPTDELSAAESDGVVNTLSMCWPHDPDDPGAHPIRLVKADHGDIIGHYARKAVSSPLPSGRLFWAYDFFPSGSGFDDATFRAVWEDVFDFCTSP